MTDTDTAFLAVLDQTGLRDLDAADLAFLREVHEKYRRPMALPRGFSPADPPCASALYIDPCGPL